MEEENEELKLIISALEIKLKKEKEKNDYLLECLRIGVSTGIITIAKNE